MDLSDFVSGSIFFGRFIGTPLVLAGTIAGVYFLNSSTFKNDKPDIVSSEISARYISNDYIDPIPRIVPVDVSSCSSLDKKIESLDLKLPDTLCLFRKISSTNYQKLTLEYNPIKIPE